jgi:hypothetical protein
VSVLGDLLARVDGCECDLRPKRVGATTDSIALVACNNGKGVLLAFDGDGIEADVEALGLGRVVEPVVVEVPDGLSIWEGHLATYRCGERGEEYEAQLEGKFRPLTAEEWERYRTAGLPWSFELLDR